jgi:pimeloyl-ACP methyl ester carboxylesterase
VATAYALEFPREIAGLVLLAPLTHPMPNSSAWHKGFVTAVLAESGRSAALPILGPLVASTFALPLGKLLLERGVHGAFSPQQVPASYLAQTAAELLLRPSEFAANAEDLAQIDDILKVQAARYPTISTHTVVITGDQDEALSPEIHAKAIAGALRHSRLLVLPGVGHMIHYAAPQRIADAVAELIRLEMRSVDQSWQKDR